MTTLNVNLSAALQSTLGQSGVWAYAVYFNASGDPVWTPVVENGSLPSSGTTSFALPEPYVGGKIYFLIQSQDASQPNDLETLITGESDINWDNAKNWDFRFDSFEVTLQNGPNDVGNLTSVNGFGLPMELSVSYSDGTTDTRGYNVSGADMFANIGAIPGDVKVYQFENGPLAGDNRAAISPSEAVGLADPNPAFKASDWTAYIDSLKTSDLDIDISGFFNGAPDANGVWHDEGFFAYEAEWDAAAQAFWLSPAENSSIQGYIKLTPSALANSIYSTLGNVGIYTNQGDAEPYQIFKHAAYSNGDWSMNTGENNQWGEVLTQFLTGFTAGFYGVSGAPENSNISTTVDLNKNWNWDPTFAFGKNLASAPAVYQDPYSEVFFFNSNSYGSGYSDNLMKEYSQGGPLISVTNAAANTNVAAIDVTIFDDSETPSGYVTPEIYNYTAPGAAGYQMPTSTTSANTVKFNFANAEMVLSEDTALSLDIYTGLQNPGEPQWQTVDFVAPSGQSLWQQWNLSYGADGYTATLLPGTPQDSGQLLISNFATAESGVAWYRVNVGEGDAKKTFNFYTETAGSDGNSSAFLNPNYQGQESSIAIDGLASISPQASTNATISAFTINFLYSGTSTVDPSLLEYNLDPVSAPPAPNAPVAGSVNGSSFNALSGQSAQVSNDITASAGKVAFGWTGLNNSTVDSSSWISGVTNKVGALNFAKINVTSSSGATIGGPIVAQADIDGQWRTGEQFFGNGVYTLTMSEYLSSDTSLSNAVGTESSALTMTVDVSEYGLATSAGGKALDLSSEAGAHVEGNFVKFETLNSSAAAGTTLLIYAVNESGELVSRDGEHIGGDVTLDDAVLASLGSVQGDEGLQFLAGGQTVYLPVGQELRFAVLTGEKSVNLNPDVSIAVQEDGSAQVQVDDIVINAETDNTLSTDTIFAGGQRANNEPIFYMKHGETIDLDVVGSSANTNTIGFVRLDVDPALGGVSVGGVSSNDGEAFRQAVRDNLDGGFIVDRGGDFTETVSWTVEGDTGYYAPVMLSQNGDTFVIAGGSESGVQHIRSFGENTFGFEDLTYEHGSDFDFNDVVVRLKPEGSETTPPIVIETPVTETPDPFWLIW